MHCKGLTGLARRHRPYHPVTQDGTPRIATNEVDRDFRQGGPRRVLSTDITDLPCTAARHGFMYPGAVIDCQTNRILAWNTSESLAEPLVLDTLDQPGEQHVTDQT